MFSTILCVLAMSEMYAPNLSESYLARIDYVSRLGTCIQIANATESMSNPEIPPSLTVALAYEESAFTDATSKAGARGPMQVIPHYVCDGVATSKCDLIKAGLKALVYWRGVSKTIFQAVCRYNSGNRCSKAGRGYAKRVLLRQKRYQLQMKHISYDFERD